MKKIGRLFGMVILLSFLIVSLAVMIPMLLVVDGIELIIRVFKTKDRDEQSKTDQIYGLYR